MRLKTKLNFSLGNEASDHDDGIEDLMKFANMPANEPGNESMKRKRPIKKWRENKDYEIKLGEQKLDNLKESNNLVETKMTGLFGALAFKCGGHEDLCGFKKQFMMNKCPNYFHHDVKSRDHLTQLAKSKNEGDKNKRKATYLKKLVKSVASLEKIVEIKKMVVRELSQDINRL